MNKQWIYGVVERADDILKEFNSCFKLFGVFNFSGKKMVHLMLFLLLFKITEISFTTFLISFPGSAANTQRSKHLSNNRQLMAASSDRRCFVGINIASYFCASKHQCAHCWWFVLECNNILFLYWTVEGSVWGSDLVTHSSTELTGVSLTWKELPHYFRQKQNISCVKMSRKYFCLML